MDCWQFPTWKKKHSWGEFVTLDGQTIEAKLDWRLGLELKQKQKQLGCEASCQDAVFLWKVYPRSFPFRLDLIGRKPLDDISASEKQCLRNKQVQLDEFRIVGEIVGAGKGRVRVSIHRNEPPPLGHENAFRYRANILSLKGDFSSSAIGQIWELKVRLEQTMLVTIAANPYQVNSTDLIALKGAGKRNAGNNALAQIKSGGKQPNSNTSATDLASVESESINVSNRTQLQANQHLNQKSLSDVGVIASVESESISVSSNIQQQPAQHKDQKRMAIAANDTATPKIVLSPGQESPKNIQQQSVSPTKAKISSERKQHYKDKQSLATSTTFEAKQLVPVFRVKANDQIFSGYNSVTLNNRMLRIDGKAVAQAKMVVVVGQPQSIQADGKVSQKGNSAVLISR